MSEAEPLIRIEGVTKVYDMGVEKVHALRGVDLDIMPNEYVAIMGSSGSGKSTLLNILGLLDVPTDGRYIRVDPEAFGLDEVRTMLEDLSRTQRKDTIEINRDEGYPFGAWPALLLLLLSLALPDRRKKEES